jgi:hypothetical protein
MREEWKERNAARLREFNRDKVRAEESCAGQGICSRWKELKPVEATVSTVVQAAMAAAAIALNFVRGHLLPRCAER